MLAKAEWPLLKKADFYARLGRGPSWELLFVFSLFSAACLISSVLGVSGPRCFDEHGEGAEGLLGALCRCRELEDGAEKVDVCLKAESPQPPLQKTYVAGAVAEAETVE